MRKAARCARLSCTPPESAQSAMGDRSSSAAWRCVGAVPTAGSQKRKDPLMNISLDSLLLARQLAHHSEPGTLYFAASVILKGVWRNGSASDSRSEGWEFESLCPHFLPMLAQLWTEANELHGEHQ